MDAEEGSGITGLILTLIIYCGAFVLAKLVIYEYLVYVHREARVLDIWRRINGQAEEFFIPDDFEVSKEELMSLCTRAKIWRGPDGRTRKVEISEFVDRDPLDDEFEETTKHYAIYECTSTGHKTMHRHFVMLPSGAIIEAFDQFTGPQASVGAAVGAAMSDHSNAAQKLLALDANGGVAALSQAAGFDGTAVDQVGVASQRASLLQPRWGHKRIFAGIENA